MLDSTPRRRVASSCSPKGKDRTVRKPPPKGTAAGTPGKPRHRTEPNPAEVEARRQERLEYDRQRNQTPERMEYHQRYQQERRRQAKLLGLCKSCTNSAILGQTRCPTCAEKHRESRRRSKAKRTAIALELP